MSHEFIELGNGQYACVEPLFRGRIQQVVEKSGTLGAVDKLEAIEKICADQYLKWDAWEAMLQRDNRERYKRCRELFREFIGELEAGNIELKGLEGTTGKTAVTAKQLRDREIPLLDVAPGWLLIQVFRHPSGGKGRPVSEHFWLYDSHNKTAELLRPIRRSLKKNFDNPLKQDEAGNWHEFTERKEFLQLVEDLIGEGGRKKIEKITEFQPILLSSPEKIILEQCNERTGVDYNELRKTRVSALQKRYEKKHGKLESGSPRRLSINTSKDFKVNTLNVNYFFSKLVREASEYFSKTGDGLTTLENERPPEFHIIFKSANRHLRISLDQYKIKVYRDSELLKEATLEVKLTAELDDEYDLEAITMKPEGNKLSIHDFFSWLSSQASS